MAGRYPIVVQGEASETDSDDEVYITSLTPSVGAKVVLHALSCMRGFESDLCTSASDLKFRFSHESTFYLIFCIFFMDAFRFQGRRLKRTARASRSRLLRAMTALRY